MLYKEYSNTQGVNDMGISPTHLPGYAKAEKATDGDIFKALANGEVKVVIIAGADPVTFAPDTEAVTKALSSAEFLIVTASYNNATRRNG